MFLPAAAQASLQIPAHFRHFQHTENCNVPPDVIEIVAIDVFEDRRYLSRLQVDGDKAALLRGSCQLSVLCQCIGLSVRGNICLPKGNISQHTPACLILVFRFPTGENLKRAAGQRTRDERRGCLVVRINHSIVVFPVFHQRLQITEAGITGRIVMPAAALVARDISRSGYGVIGLNIGPEERIPLPEPAGRSGGGHVTKYSNVLLRNRIGRSGNFRTHRGCIRVTPLCSLVHRSGIAAAQDRYHGNCCKQQAQHSLTGQHGHLLVSERQISGTPRHNCSDKSPPY